MAWKNFLLNRLRKNANSSPKSKSTTPRQHRKASLLCEPLETRELLTVYTPGDLIVLQSGDGTSYTNQAPLFLNEYSTTASASMVQQASVPNNQAVGGTTNQPITLDLTAAAGNGQLTRSYDGSVLTFGGVDSGINNGGLVSPQTPTGSSDRVTAITGNNLNNITAASWSSGTVTITTQNAHGFSNGQTVTITGMTPTGYNGTFTIATTAQNNKFTYSLTSNPGTASTLGVAANVYDSTTHGQYYVGDDNRGAVAESASGPIYAVGHPNQAGAAVSQGVLYFAGPGPAAGTQVSLQGNIRGATIGFDNRLYFTTAGSTAVGLAGVYTESAALPTAANANPSSDVPVVKALFSASKLGGVFLADVNGDGIVDNGDRIYFLDDGTVGGAGTGGVYMSVFDTNRYGGSNAVAGQAAGWSPAIRLGEGIISAQPTPQPTAQLRGLAGTVLYASNNSVQLYASEFDNVAGNNSYILGFLDNTPGVLTVTQASESGTTATITARELVSGTIPSGFSNGASVTINNVSSGTGTTATTGGYNGVFTISGTPTDNGDGTFSFSYTAATSGLGTISNPSKGVTDLFVSPTTIQTQANGTGPTSHAAVGLRGVAFAPVAPTTVSLAFTPANPVTPGAQVTFTATLSNSQVGASGLNGNTVTFIDQNTNTVLGTGTISTTGGVTTATFSTSPALVGNHFVVAYFAGGGTSALASATSNSVQVLEAGIVTSSTALTSTLSAVAVGAPVTLTATVTGTLITAPVGSVSFYNGSVALANLLGTATVNSSSVATLTTTFAAVGSQSIIAVYNGDNTYASSQAQLTITTTPNATATITSSANNVALNATPTYTVTLNGNSTLGSPTGGVQFYLQNTFTGATAPLGGFGISSISESGSTVTVTTSSAHGFSVGQQVTVFGVTSAQYNGTVTITSVPTSTTFTYTSSITGLSSSSGGFATPFIALTSGSNNTSSASITSSSLANPGSYLVTVVYNASGTNNPYASFALDTSTSANGTAFIETVQQAFTPGNLVAVQRGDGSVNLGSSGYLVFLTEYTTSGTLVQKVAMPNIDATRVGITSVSESGTTVTVTTSGTNPFTTVGQQVIVQGVANAAYNGVFTVASATGTSFTYTNTNTGGSGLASSTGGFVTGGSSHALLLSGQNSTEGLLNRSANGYFLTVAGYDLPVGRQFVTSTFPYQYPRTIARVDLSGNINSSTAIGVAQNSGQSVPYNPLDVVSADGTQFWMLSDLPNGDTSDGSVLFATLGGNPAVQVTNASGSPQNPDNPDDAAIQIIGGQLTISRGAGDVQAVGTGEPTTSGQALVSPYVNLKSQYQALYTKQNPEQVLALNTLDGTSNNPNVVYIADQANGLLKFERNDATISSMSESGTTVTVTTSATNSFVDAAAVNSRLGISNAPTQFIQIGGAANPAFNGVYAITIVDSTHFTFTAAAGLGSTTGGTATQWEGGRFSDNNFSQKLVGSSGVTGVVGVVNNPGGTSSTSVTLYVTGTPVSGQNPNQLDVLNDSNAGAAGSSNGIDQGFSHAGTDIFNRIAFVGQTGSGSSASPNGNMNFAGLAWAPGYQTSVALQTSAATASFGTSITYTATVSASGTGSGTPTGVVTFFDGPNVIGTGTLNSSGVATLSTSALGSGSHSITAFYNGDVKDGTSTSSGVSETISFVSGDVVVSQVGTGSGSLTSSTATTFINQYTTSGTTNGSTPMPTASLSATVSSIAESGTTATATTSAAHGFAVGESVTISGSSVSGYNKTFTITAVTSTTFTFTATSGLGSATGGTASVTRFLTESGTSTGEGYITSSLDGQTLGIAGYNVAAGNSTSGVNRDIAVLSASGATDLTTQLPSGTGNVRVAISADGQGFFVATSTGIRYVPFANAGAASTQITAEVSSPTAVGIGTNNTTGSGTGTPGQLFGSAGAGAQSNGVPALDSPYSVGSGLPQVAGQGLAVSSSFPTARDTFNNFPTTNQFAISPDGNTIFIADSRTDSVGGILEYFQSLANNWTLVGHLQLDNFSISSATESGTTVTITTSSAHNFTSGQSVSINGVSVGGYNTTATVTVVDSTHFTYTLPSSGLASGSGGTATSTDGGLRGLVADFSGSSPVLYATTSATTGNRLVKITGATLDGSTASFSYTTLATAPANTAFRGVALSPKATGTTTSSTSLAVTNSPATYGTGVTLTATVTTGATGWVSFRQNGVEIGVAPVVTSGGTSTATFVTAGNLGASSSAYSIVAVYTGDSTYAPSTSSSQSATINQASSSTTLGVVSNGQTLSSGASIATGQSITLTATVSVPSGTAATGTVTFFNGSTPVGTTVRTISAASWASNVATVTTSAAHGYSVGQTVQVTGMTPSGYNGIFTITATTSTTFSYALTTNPGTATAFGNSVLPSAVSQVIVNQSGSAAVTFQASNTTSFTSLGSLSLTAVYNGDSNFSTSTSSAFSLSVVNTTAVTVTTSNTNPTSATSVNVTYTATISSGDTSDTISGSVQFYDDLLPIGSAVSVSGTSGVQVTSSAFATGLLQSGTTLVPGLHSITAIYTPDSTGAAHFGSGSGVYEQNVQGTSFGSTDVFAYRVGDGTTNLIAQSPNSIAGAGSIGSTIYIDEFTSSGTAVQSFILPTADSQAFSVSAASESGTTVTLTTAAPHNFAVGDKVTVAGITPAGYSGTFTITAVTSTTIQYTAAASLGTATLTNATATGIVHAAVGNGQQSATEQLSESADGQTLWLAAYDNNPLNAATASGIPTAASTPRAVARLSSSGVVQTEGLPSSISSTSNSTANFNGVFSPDGNQFYVTNGFTIYYFSSFAPTAGLVSASATIGTVPNSTGSLSVNSNALGLENDGGNLAVVGQVYGSPTSASLVGAYTGLPTASTAGLTLSSLTESGTTVTATTSAANGLVTGATVVISGATVSGYNGTVTVTVIDSTHFTYTASTSGLANDTSGTGRATESLLLPGLPSTDNFQLFPIDVYFTHLGGTGAPAGINTFYLSDDGPSFANGRITKWALSSSGTWSLVDTITAQGASGTGNTAVSFYWLAGMTDSSGNVTLDVSYGNGGNSDTGPGFVYSISDTNGWNQPIGTGGSHSDTISTVATVASGSNEVFRGVAFRMNQAPSITSPNTTTFSFGLAGTFTAKAIGTSSITWSETGTLPTGVSLSSAGVLSGTPTQSGTFNFTLTATNSVGSANQSFTLVVNPGTAPAFTSASSTTFTVGTAGSFTVTASGSPAPTLSESGTDTLPSGVTFTASTGVLSGTPGAGTGGTYTLHFTAHNGVGTDATQTFTLTVGQAPAITSSSSTTFTQGSSGSFTVTATGFPTPTFSETGVLPFGVTFNSTTGVLSGTPTVFGTFPITISASNGVGTTATQNFTLNVTGTSFGIYARPDGSKAVSITPDGIVLTFSGPINASTVHLWDNSAPNFTVTNNGTPVAGSLVIDPSQPQIVTFVATQGAAAMTSGTYTVTIAPAGSAVSISSASWASTGGGTVTIQTSAAPTVAYAVGQVVTISGMTPSGYNGTFTIASVVDSTHFTYALASNPGATTTLGSATQSGPQGSGGVNGSGFSSSVSMTTPTTPIVTAPYFSRGAGQTITLPVTITGGSVTQASFDLTFDPTQLSIAATGAVTASTAATNAGLTTISYSVSTIDAHHGLLSVKASGGTGLSSSATISAASWGTVTGVGNAVTVTVSSAPTSPYAVGQTVVISGMTPSGYNGTFTIASVVDSTHFTYALASNPGTATAFGTAVNSVAVVNIAASVPNTATYLNKAVINVQNAFVNNNPAAAVSAANEDVYFTDTNGDGRLSAQDESLILQAAAGLTRGFSSTKDLDPVILGDADGNQRLGAQDGSFVAQAATGTTVSQIPTIPISTITAASWSSGVVTITVSAAPAVSFVTGEQVTIINMTPSGYNGTFTIASVVDSTHFTYALATNPGTATAFGTFTVTPPTGADPKLYFVNAQAGAGQTVTIALDLKNTDTSTITAASFSSGTVTITTSSAHGLQAGETVTISGMTPSGYNGTFTVGSVTSTTTFTYSLSSDPGTATAFGTAAGTFALSSLDEAILFDPTKFTVSNVRTGSLLTGASGWSTTANVDNTNGFIRVAQATSSPTSMSPNTNGDVLLFDVTVSSSLSVGTTIPLNLASSVTSNGSTTFTDANTNSGSLTLSPAPTNNSNDAVDGTLTVVGPNGTLAFSNATAVPGNTFTAHLTFTNGVIPLNVSSLDEAILFDPSVLQVVSASTGTDLANATGWSTTTNFNNTSGFIRVAQATSNPTAVAAGAVVDVLDITFQVNANASGTTILNLASSVTSNGSTTFTDVNQNSGSITLNPAPTNAATDTGVDGTVTIVVQPNEPPFDRLPAPSKIAQVLFNPANLTGLVTNNANTVTFSPTGGAGGVSDAITVTDPDTFMTVTAASESGTTVTITTTDPISFTVGQSVVIAGITPSGYDGTFTITAVSGSTFTYTAASALGSATLSGATAAISLSNPANAIASASESSTTVTITTSQPTGFVTGENVVIAGMTPSGYNGTFAITVVDSTHFTYTAASGLGTATAVGTATLSPLETTELKLTGSGTSTGAVGKLTLASTTNLTVTGNNTSDVIITGTLTDINNALNGLKYTPGAGFYGTATLAVSTNDNGNSHFGGPLVDTRSTTVTVVGLFLSEIFLNSTSNLSTPSANQYLEIFSTVASYTIPSSVYVVGIQGNNSEVVDQFGNDTVNTPGDVTDVFKLGGFTTGSNGYLALLQKGQPYTGSSANVVNSSGNVQANAGSLSGPGFGNGSSSTYGSLSGVHVGQDQNGVGVRLGTNPDLPGDGATAAGELSWDMPQGSSSYLLIQTSTAPSVQTSSTTATNIDGGSTTTATIAGGSAYNSWNVLDGVAILASPLSPTTGTYTQNGPDRSYAPITFKAADNTGTVMSGATTVTTGTTASPWTANYVGRIDQNTGSSSADWLASVPAAQSTSGLFTLDTTKTSNSNLAGQRLNTIGGPNTWATEMQVFVNDGTSNQHSQVSELTVTFSAPVTLAGQVSKFTVTAATDNGSTAGTATVTTSATHNFVVGQSVSITGVTGTGWNGTKTITAVTSTTITFSRGTITANGTTSGTSAATALNSGIGSTTFQNIFQVLADSFKATISTATESGSTVTVTTSAAHGFSVGQQVAISGVSVSGYNGTFTITAVTSTTFTYTATATSLAGGTGGTATPTVSLTFIIPTGFGTYNATTGQGTNVTKLVIKFLNTTETTTTFNNADPLGNTVGLVDGNFFLNTDTTKVTDQQSKQLDGDRDGNFGGNGHDEFWRLFGDVNGDRQVDGLDNDVFRTAYGTTSTQSGYLWYLDFELSLAIDNADRTQFRNRMFTQLPQ
jgi:hypothetical protein